MQQILKDKKIIQLFLMLIEKYCTKDELIEKLSIKSATLSQYIAIIKATGFKLCVQNKKYKIEYFKNKLKLDEIQTSLLAHIINLSTSMLSNKQNKHLLKIINEILYFSNNEEFNKTYKKYKLFNSIKSTNENKQKIEKFQEALDKNKILKIELKNSYREFILKPIKYSFKANKTCLIFENLKENKYQEILANDITKLTLCENRSYINRQEETIFELYGRMARNYVLKDDEKIIDRFEDKIVVSNISSDKNMLYKRLFRYDTLCKIIYPKNHVENYIKIIEKSLDNIR